MGQFPNFRLFLVDHLQLGTFVLYSKKYRAIMKCLRIVSCLACVYRVVDARGGFGEHERDRKSVV